MRLRTLIAGVVTSMSGAPAASSAAGDRSGRAGRGAGRRRRWRRRWRRRPRPGVGAHHLGAERGQARRRSPHRCRCRRPPRGRGGRRGGTGRVGRTSRQRTYALVIGSSAIAGHHPGRRPAPTGGRSAWSSGARRRRAPSPPCRRWRTGPTRRAPCAASSTSAGSSPRKPRAASRVSKTNGSSTPWHAPSSPPSGGCGPVEAVHPRRGATGLGKADGGHPEGLVAGDGGAELARGGARSGGGVRGDQVSGLGIVGRERPDGGEQLGIVGRQRPAVEGGEQVELVAVGPDQEGHRGGGSRRQHRSRQDGAVGRRREGGEELGP